MKKMKFTASVLALGVCAVTSIACSKEGAKENNTSTTAEPTEKKVEKKADPKSEWIQLFDGKSLNGWTPKFSGSDLGVNYKDTFEVKDGVLRVNYDQYEKWNGEFGHLFYEKPFSNYILRCEYRFVGKQVKGGPGWARRNNGFMIHGQDPKTMGKDQDFPDSIEVQLLGGLGGNRATLNACTPGTHIVLNGKLTHAHVIPSKGPTFQGDQWVTIEVEVRGGEVIKHKVDGKVVLEYTKPQLNNGTILTGGTISIQAESHPTEFRKIEIKELPAKEQK